MSKKIVIDEKGWSEVEVDGVYGVTITEKDRSRTETLIGMPKPKQPSVKPTIVGIPAVKP